MVSKSNKINKDTILKKHLHKAGIYNCDEVLMVVIWNAMEEWSDFINKKQAAIKKRDIHGGLSYHKLYQVRCRMIDRCYNNNLKNWDRYGGRGIKVCDEWRNSYLSFYLWAINNGWKDGLYLDRIDNNSNYSPDNCRFVTLRENINNRENTFFVTHNGATKPLSEWSEIYNFPHSLLSVRIKSGLSLSEAVAKKVNKNNKLNITIDGITKSLKDWCKIYKTSYNCAYRRIGIGWPPQDAVKINKNGRYNTRTKVLRIS